jgi:hypothetical protein
LQRPQAAAYAHGPPLASIPEVALIRALVKITA